MRRLGIAIIGVLVIGLIGLVIYRSLAFHLVSTSPKAGNQKASTSNGISFNFNKDLASDSSDNTISIKPAIPGSTKVSGKTVTFIPSSPLADSQSYTVTLSNITDVDGAGLSPVTITFKALYVPFAQLPASEQQKAINQQDQQYDAPTAINKLINSLPYQTALYTLSYSAGNYTFTVAVGTSNIAGAEAEANSYIKSFGVDPSTLTINDSIPAVYSGHPGP